LAGASTGRLAGVRVAITRASHQADELAALLVGQGASPVLVPAIKLVDPAQPELLQAALDRLPDGYDGVVVTSVNAAERILDRAPADRFERACVAAVGTGTAEALRRRGVVVDVLPARFRAEGLLSALDEAFAERGGLAGTRWLLPRAEVARELLPEGLRARGARVDVVAAYRNVPASTAPLEAALGEGLDAITFAAGSAVESFAGSLGSRLPALLDGVVVASIGPVTSRACRESGLAVDVEPAQARLAELVEALAGFWEERR
jgi:uroporphyrinogen-III synthase